MECLYAILLGVALHDGYESCCGQCMGPQRRSRCCWIRFAGTTSESIGVAICVGAMCWRVLLWAVLAIPSRDCNSAGSPTCLGHLLFVSFAVSSPLLTAAGVCSSEKFSQWCWHGFCLACASLVFPMALAAELATVTPLGT